MTTAMEKQLAQTISVFEEVERYFQKREKINDAFSILNQKIVEAEQKQKEILRKSGALEVKKLLGKAGDEKAQAIDANLSEVREQKDKLAAAIEALEAERKSLEDDAAEVSAKAQSSLGALAHAFHQDIDGELQEIARRINSIADRLTAFKNATHFGQFNDTYLKVELPSLINGENLCRAPISYLREKVDPWQQSPDAVRLYDRLVPFGKTYRRLENGEDARFRRI